MIQEGRFSDVLSESQIARMNGNKEGRNAGIVEGLRMAAEMFRDGKLVSIKESVSIDDDYDFYRSILFKAKEIEEAAK